MVSTSAFLTSFITSFVIFTVLVYLFSAFLKRRVNWPVLFPRRLLSGSGEPNENDLSILSWFHTAMTASVQDVIQASGMDGAVMLQFQSACLRFLIYAALFCIPVLIPLAATSNYIDYYNSTQSNPNKKLAVSDIDKLAMGNIPPKSNLLWVFAIGAYWLTISTLAVLYGTYKNIALLRAKYQSGASEANVEKSSNGSGEAPLSRPELYTVLVRDIPKPRDQQGAMGGALTKAVGTAKSLSLQRIFGGCVSDEDAYSGIGQTPRGEGEGVEAFLRRVFGAEMIGMKPVLKMDKTTAVWKELVANKKKLEHAQMVLRLTPSGERPQHKTGFLGLMGAKVDSIDFYTEQIKELESKLADEQRAAEEQGTGAALVFFRSRLAAAASAQVQLSDEADKWNTEQAPSPPDVLWANLGMSYHERTSKSLLVYFFVFLMVLFFMIPISFISSLTTLSNLEKTLPFLKPIVTQTALETFLEAFLPQLVLIVFLALLPMIMTALSSLEGLPSLSHTERAATGKYFYFNVFNVFLGVTLTGTLFSSLKTVTKDPSSIVNLLATSLPGNASFFITYIALNFLVGYGKQLSCVVPLLIFHIKRKFLIKSQSELNAAWNPGPFSYVSGVSSDMLVVTLCLCYGVIAPLIIAFGIAHFFLAWLVTKYQFLNVVVPDYDSHGRFWPHMHARVVASLVLAQITALGYFAIKKFVGAVVLIPLPIITIVYYLYVRGQLYQSFYRPSLDVASQPCLEKEGGPSIEELVEAYTPPMMQSGAKATEEDERIALLPGVPQVDELLAGKLQQASEEA